MGRRKIGKQRRPRPPRRTWTLQDLAPPGSCYEEWIRVPAGLNASRIAEDPRVSPEGVEFMERVHRLAGHYDGSVPMGAVLLDMALDSGVLPMKCDGEGPRLLPLDEAASMFGGGAVTPDGIRDSVHELHAAGMLLVEPFEEAVVVRMVTRRPERAGERWVFADDEDGQDDGDAKTCIPNGAVEKLSVEQFGVFAYLRACEAAGEEGSVDGFLAESEWAMSRGRLVRLFDEVAQSGWLDHKGCAACPAGHLCSREDETLSRS